MSGKPTKTRRPRPVADLWAKYCKIPLEDEAAQDAFFDQLTPDEMRMIEAAELTGWRPGDLPIDLHYDRERALDSPYVLITEVLDEFPHDYYKKHFEPTHQKMLDEVAGPYVRNETVRIEGHDYKPEDYLGLIVLMTRTTYKSTLAGFLAFYHMLWLKIRKRQDARVMYTHQQIEKAVERGEVIRNHARHNKKFRARFPDFHAPKGEWDKQNSWRWPGFTSYSAAEWSFKAYGESSNKTGGHYTLRVVDDWETEESVTTSDQIAKSKSRFEMMDNLKIRGSKFNPQLIMGTTYHFQGLHATLKRNGGYMVYEVPAHTGSPKKIFDLLSIDRRSKEGRAELDKKLKALEKAPPGRLNFPGLLGWKDLYLSALAQGPNHYNTQMLLNPVPEGEERFSHEDVDAALCETLPDKHDTWLYIRCDPAIGKKKSNDETAILVGGVDWMGHRWVMDGWSGREKRPTEIVRKMFAFGRKWQERGYKVKNIGVESVQYQESLAMLCRMGVPEKEAAHHGESIPVVKSPCLVVSITRSPDMRKEERILELDGPLSRREVKIWPHAPVNRKLVTQLKHFPHDKDDLLDAFHDLWVKTQYPPRAKQAVSPIFHPLIQEILGARADKEGKIHGTHNTVKLMKWG